MPAKTRTNTLHSWQKSNLPSPLACLFLFSKPRSWIWLIARCAILLGVFAVCFVNFVIGWGSGIIGFLVGNLVFGCLIFLAWLGCWLDIRQACNRSRRFECIECGYSLQGNIEAEECPECGAYVATGRKAR